MLDSMRSGSVVSASAAHAAGDVDDDRRALSLEQRHERLGDPDHAETLVS